VVYGEKTKDNLYQINVKDSGVGINEKMKEELFSSAHYISTTGTTGEVGTGFGLALCKDFVNRNGGEIYVDNNHNEPGTTFSFTVPVA
jgi:signal transduction histidine kinase